jgi:hypothetical protein
MNFYMRPTFFLLIVGLHDVNCKKTKNVTNVLRSPFQHYSDQIGCKIFLLQSIEDIMNRRMSGIKGEKNLILSL